MNKYNVVSYFGGKYPVLNWLLPLFPQGNYHFVDMMCGSANVALNLNYPLITINDLNSEVVNLFYVMRNYFDVFLEKLYLTPFSRDELNRIIEDNKKGIILDEIERARRYYILCNLGYGANASQNNHKGMGFEFAMNKTKYYRVLNYNTKLFKLPYIAEKLRGFQIENTDMFSLYEKVNKKDCILYFDPPYVLSSRKSKKRYHHEWDDDMHRRLADTVKNSKAFVAISGVECELYNDIYPTFYRTKNKITKNNTGKSETQECLFTNYNPLLINGVLSLEI